jgi:thymidine phosphorylase
MMPRTDRTNNAIPMRDVSAAQRGCFFLVVGPSGAGKDSLMDGAKQTLLDKGFVFAKRVITKPPGMVGEDYTSCTAEEFKQRSQNLEFLITWQAHGYDYGLERTLLEQQARGRHIVANGSRSIVNQIKDAVPNLVVVLVTAPVETLAKRLADRGRETEPEIKERLQRQTQPFDDITEVLTIVNDGSLPAGIEKFTDALLERSRR